MQTPAEKPPWRESLFVRLWQILHHPLLMIGVAALILLLSLAALTLPQLPGQLMDEPIERSRWLAAIQEEYGLPGPLLAGLGLFNLTQSLILRLLLALLTLLVLLQLGDLLIMWQQRRYLRRLLRQPATGNMALLSVPGLRPLYRRRLTLSEPPTAAALQLRQSIVDATEASTNHLLEERQPLPAAESVEEQVVEKVERRWLVLQAPWALRLRFIAMLGVGMALAISWLALNWGWEIRPPILAPGDEYRLPSRNLSLAYQVAGEANAEGGAASAQRPLLAIRMSQQSDQLPVTEPNWRRLDNVSVWVQPAVPALLVESWQNDEPVLALTLTGQEAPAKRLGFTFPAAGSEESIVIPEARVALRIVQLRESSHFLVEIVHTDTQEVERIELHSDDALIIPVAPDHPGDPLVLRFRFLPGLDVRLRYVPGEWLFWPALLLAAIGSLGFWRRPCFLLCQLAHWPPNRSVVIIQSDDPNIANSLAERMAGDDKVAG
jgi:hypothetical protein